MTTHTDAHPPGHANHVEATVFTSSWPTITNGTFSPTTSTLFTGPSEAVLVDAQFLTDDVQALGDSIEATGRRLTTIYLTHGHPDHYLGFATLVKRFPGARAVTKPEVIEYITDNFESQQRIWANWFGDRCTAFGPVPETLDDDVLYVDGSPLHIVDIGQADIAPTTIVHAPDIATVVAGDAVYNEIHAMLGLGGPAQWADWLLSLDTIEALAPTTVVAGHKKPGAADGPAIPLIAATRKYIQDFEAVVTTATSGDDAIATMSKLYPHHGNLFTLQFSVTAYFSRA